MNVGLKLLSVAVILLAGCQFLPLPTNQPEVPRPASSDFLDVFAPSPTPTANSAAASPSPYDPFTITTFTDVDTATKFAPKLTFTLDALKAGNSPGVTTDIYQTKAELEVRETHTLIEHASFHFEKLKVGMLVGGGQVDVGTPPKLTVPITVQVTETDSLSSAILSVRSDSPIAKIYVADLQVKVLYGSLSIVSIANASRANDKDGVHTIPASLRVIQKLDPGYVQLPDSPQVVRTRVIVTSEQDPGTNVAGQRVYNDKLTITP
ncbi:MAG: hypothetical protein JWM80_3546 [Cyanobacteria bacterium RYN_339]|nr:hypothetical protein [Cyanobacteria bacterium RYN_339]